MEEQYMLAKAIVQVLKATDLRSGDPNRTIAPYVTVRIGHQSFSTSTYRGANPSSPHWENEKFEFKCSTHHDERISFTVYDQTHYILYNFDPPLGTAKVGLPQDQSSERAPQWLNLGGEHGSICFQLTLKLPEQPKVAQETKEPPTEKLSRLQALIEDVKKLGPRDSVEAVKLLVHALTSKGEYQDDRQGAMDEILHLLARVPASSNIITALQPQFLQTLWDDIEKPPTVLAGDYFRSADGSGNSRRYPQTGAAETHYARTVTECRPHVPTLPDPGDIFDMILSRNNQPAGPGGRKFVPHPNNINVVLFYLATLITHDLFYSDPENPTKNTTSSYLDLSPLYGRNIEEQNKVRLFKHGLLKPDAFSELRFVLQPQGVSALLVLFSRNHNYIAKMLLENNEGGRFSNHTPDGRPVTSKMLDDKLFQTARLVNCGCYLNIIVHDYLHAILGGPADSFWTLDPTSVPPQRNSAGGNQIAIEFNFVYRWHAAIGADDEVWAENIIKKYKEIIEEKERAAKAAKAAVAANESDQPLPEKQKRQFTTYLSQGQLKYGVSSKTSTYENLPSADVPEAAPLVDSDHVIREKPPAFNTILKELVHRFDPDTDWSRGTPIIRCLRQPENHTFPDKCLGDIFTDAINQVAGRPGANHIPAIFKEIEEGAIYQGRLAGTCSLNALREHLKLQRYKTFREINPDPDVHEALAKLYKSPDDVELYPGLVAEEAKTFGLALTYTTSRGILSDAVNLIRNDRFYMEDFTNDNLTSWGYRFAKGDLTVNAGSIMHSLLLLHIPGYFPPDSIYVWDCMHLPPPNTPRPSTYEDPLKNATEVAEFADVTAVLQNKEVFNLPYTTKMLSLVGKRSLQLNYERDLGNISLYNPSRADLFQWAKQTSEAVIMEHALIMKEGNSTLDVVDCYAKQVAIRFMEHALGITTSTRNGEDHYATHTKLAEQLDQISQWLFNDTEHDSVVHRKRAVVFGGELNNYINGLLRECRQALKGKEHKDNLLMKLAEAQLKVKKSDREAAGLTDEIIAYNTLAVAVGTYTNIYRAASLIIEYLLKEGNEHLAAIKGTTDQATLEKYMLESLRLHNEKNVPLIIRVASQNTTVRSKGRDVEVKESAFVALCIDAAMNDPAEFPNPEKFDLDRPHDKYLMCGDGLYHRYDRPLLLAVVAGIVHTITRKDNLTLSKMNKAISYLTYKADISPYPQHLLVKFKLLPGEW